MCEVFTADTILKQTEEDCRYLCTGDGILWLYFAIPVTNDVSKVVSVVQTQCVIIRNFYCRLGLGTMSAAATAAGAIFCKRNCNGMPFGYIFKGVFLYCANALAVYMTK